jgi:hypothetical protein
LDKDDEHDAPPEVECDLWQEDRVQIREKGWCFWRRRRRMGVLRWDEAQLLRHHESGLVDLVHHQGAKIGLERIKRWDSACIYSPRNGDMISEYFLNEDILWYFGMRTRTHQRLDPYPYILGFCFSMFFWWTAGGIYPTEGKISSELGPFGCAPQ